jgi:hypothetical protein
MRSTTVFLMAPVEVVAKALSAASLLTTTADTGAFGEGTARVANP